MDIFYFEGFDSTVFMLQYATLVKKKRSSFINFFQAELLYGKKEDET